MQARLESVGIKWEAPTNVETASNGREEPKPLIVDLEDMDLQTKLGFLKQNKEWKCMSKWEALKEHKATWQTNGLHDLSYDIKGIRKLDGDDEGESKVTKLTTDVKLNGNHWSNEKCGVEYLPSP
mmetsp:Transcript_13012/g.28505  ORF Transcript_13012/g.28505 Transcript_13012/m.28505 type:complete len:125 (-) Transcript_13012:74-448(-)